MKQTMREMIIKYQAELDDYIGRFIKKQGYFPISLNDSTYKYLPDKKQRMCDAFWNHADVIKCTSIMDCFGMVLADCKLNKE